MFSTKVVAKLRKTLIHKNDPVVMVKVVTNLRNILIGGYLTVEVILALTYFFAVPKVIEEIRMVFDAT